MGLFRSTFIEQGLHLYHVQKVQALESTEFPFRVIYCEWLLQQCRECPNFLYCILFTDEAGCSMKIHTLVKKYDFNDGFP